jgi:hypothetical protein
MSIYFIIGLSIKHSKQFLYMSSSDISESTIFRYYTYFKKAISKYYKTHIPLYELSGNIEIDEVYLRSKRKNNMGRLSTTKDFSIVLGLFCRDQGSSFISY